MAWILIISWTISGGHAVSMQEFKTAESCQFASVHAKRIAPNINAICVPK